jgi:hypothetical protein
LTTHFPQPYGQASRRTLRRRKEAGMQVSSSWRTASLVAGALLIGSLIGPPLAHAASAALIRIEGAHSTNVAAVSKSGRLSVNAGLTTTPSGQVEVAPASPAKTVVVTTGNNSLGCAAGGFYTVPAGKALIVTGVNFDLDAVSPNVEGTGLVVLAGPVAHPCKSLVGVADAPIGTDFETVDQVYPSGVPVPAGDALALTPAVNDDGIATIYGYLVPAAAVPHNALQNSGSARRAGVNPRH